MSSFPTFTPRYELPAPAMIGSRLAPAVAVGDGYVTVEATGRETSGRVHFRFIIEVPGRFEYVSDDSGVTTVGGSWTHAALMALETVTDALGSEEYRPDWMPADLREWLDGSDLAYMDAMCVAEELREAIEALGEA